MIRLKGNIDTVANIEIACIEFESFEDRKAARLLLDKCQIKGKPLTDVHI